LCRSHPETSQEGIAGGNKKAGSARRRQRVLASTFVQELTEPNRLSTRAPRRGTLTKDSGLVRRSGKALARAPTLPDRSRPPGFLLLSHKPPRPERPTIPPAAHPFRGGILPLSGSTASRVRPNTGEEAQRKPKRMVNSCFFSLGGARDTSKASDARRGWRN
jgi:hypothetical protein